MFDLLIFIIVDILLFFAMASLVFTLPGIWIMVILMALDVWIPWTTPYGWQIVGVAAGIAVFAEVLEFFSGILGVKKTGGSKKASWGALLGGIVGVIAGTPFLPPIGSFIGLFGGTFLGTWLVERDVNPDGSHKVALGATIARAFGLAFKFLAAGSVFALVIWQQVEYALSNIF